MPQQLCSKITVPWTFYDLDDYSICIGLMVQINLIFQKLQRLIRISNKNASIQRKKYYDSICPETGGAGRISQGLKKKINIKSDWQPKKITFWNNKQ